MRASDNIHAGAVSEGSGACECVKQYFKFKTARFDVPFYLLGIARVLASTWCLNMQHYWDIFVASGNPTYRFSKWDHESFEEPQEFQELFGLLSGPQLKRAHEQRHLQPK